MIDVVEATIAQFTKGTFSASIPQVHPRFGSVRRRQPHLARRFDPGHDAGRAHRATSTFGSEGLDHFDIGGLGRANLAPKLATIIAGMCAGADCIDDIEVLRAGGHKTLFTGVYAPATVGQTLREFTFGHARQLDSVLTNHLRALTDHVDLLPGAAERTFIDIDSLLRPVYGYAKEGASYGHSKIAGKQILRNGLSPLATTLSTDQAAPVIAGVERGQSWVR